MSGPYKWPLWAPNHFSLFHTVLPHMSGASLKGVHKRFNAIRELHNRVFHYYSVSSVVVK